MKLHCPRGHTRKTRGFQPEPDELTCAECGGRMTSFKPREKDAEQAKRSRQAISPASPAQRRKVRELGYCIACRKPASEDRAIDPAHLCDRSKGGCDHEDCVTGLCRTFRRDGCHDLYDDGKLDLLKVIAERWPAEKAEWQHMAEHLNPVEALEQLANARTQWSDAA